MSIHHLPATPPQVTWPTGSETRWKSPRTAGRQRRSVRGRGQAWLQQKLKRSQLFPVCLLPALGWPVATAKQGSLITLMGLVHYGRLISARKHCLQAAVNSDGCFSAPGTVGGVATGKLSPLKKNTQGDSWDRTSTGLTMCLFPHSVSVNLCLRARVFIHQFLVASTSRGIEHCVIYRLRLPIPGGPRMEGQKV